MINEQFFTYMGAPAREGPVSPGIFEGPFKAVFDQAEDAQVLQEYLLHYGKCTFAGSAIMFIDPAEYHAPLSAFEELTRPFVPFARTYCGNFFVLTDIDTDMSIYHFNIHTNEPTWASSRFSRFFEWSTWSREFLEDELFGEIEYPARERYGPLGTADAMVFSPTIGIGGDFDIDSMVRVNLKNYLPVLSAMYHS